MESPYLKIQSRRSSFGSAMVNLIPKLKEAGIPASVVDQLVRSATSVGANYQEARGGESKADFLHKLQVALKECREAKHWLYVLMEIPAGPHRTVSILRGECDQLCAILYSSVITAKSHRNANDNDT